LKSWYLTARDNWVFDSGHPWQLIEGYRGILLKPIDEDAARTRMMSAIDIAFDKEQGPTVRMIGAALAAIAVSWGIPWAEADTEMDRIERELPKAKARVDIIRGALAAQACAPIPFLQQVLPFNFR
jgi:hypothetical protein